MAKVIFKFKTRSQNSTPPIVVGNCPNLGDWNPADGCRMTQVSSEPGIWCTPASVLVPLDTELQYKYVFRSGGTNTWERLTGNRAIRPTSVSLIIEDQEGSYVSRVYVTEARQYSSESFSSRLELSEMFTKEGFEGDDRVLIVSMIPPMKIMWTKDEEGTWIWRIEKEVSQWVASLYQSAVEAGVVFQWISAFSFPQEAKSQWLEVTQMLLSQYHIIAVFLPVDSLSRHTEFCAKVLEPLLQGIIDITSEDIPQYSSELWEGYRIVNSIFADAIVTATTGEDLVWLHDYQLLMTPSFLNRRAQDPPLNIGMSLHQPFPPSEIFKVLPHHEALLNSLLSCDLVNFQSFYYLRHFLSACKRVLGAEFSFKRNGSVTIGYFGREVAVKASCCGISAEVINEELISEECRALREELEYKFAGFRVVLGVDHFQRSSWIYRKLEVFRDHLRTVPSDRLVLVQLLAFSSYLSPSTLRHFETIKSLANDINVAEGREAVVLITTEGEGFPLVTRLGYYAVADQFWDCALNGFSPYSLEFECVHQNLPKPIILSEFSIVCKVLKSAVQVNPLDGQEIAKAFRIAGEHQSSEEDWRMEALRLQNPTVWGQEILTDIKRARKNTFEFTFKSWGLGDKLKLVALRKNFTSLFNLPLLTDYKRTRNRLILFANEGTLSPLTGSSIIKQRNSILPALEELCKDERNSIYVLSDLGKTVLDDAYGTLKGLGLAAEHGTMIRDRYTGSIWQLLSNDGKVWKSIAEDVIDSYVSNIDGGTKIVRETYIVFLYKDADPDYGGWLAKELVSHLELVLQPYQEECEIVTGADFVEVKPAGFDKGQILKMVANKIAKKKGPIDFVLAVGDSASDEEMFKMLHRNELELTPGAAKVACTVGMKPSIAPYYLNSVQEVQKLLEMMKDSSIKVTFMQTKNYYSHNDCSEIFKSRSIGDREHPILAISIPFLPSNREREDPLEEDDM